MRGEPSLEALLPEGDRPRIVTSRLGVGHPAGDHLTVLVNPPAGSIGQLPRHTLSRLGCAIAAVRLWGGGRAGLNRTRWAADSGHRRGMAAGFRRAVLAGSVIVADPLREPSVADAVMSELGLRPLSRVRLGSGGGAAVTAGLASGEKAMLRLGRLGTPADPSRNHAGLLAAAEVPGVPAALAGGSRATVGWSLEEKLAGKPAESVDDTLVASVDTMLRRFPIAPELRAPHDALAYLSAWAPRNRDLEEIERLLVWRLEGIGGRLIHGDLWAGNLLVDGKAVVGLVDWDAWHPSGAPMTDLLHLLADGERRRRRGGYGDLVSARFWRTRHHRGLLERHMTALGIEPRLETMEALAVAWWLTSVAAALRRNPSLGEAGWIGRNLLVPSRTVPLLLA